MEVFGEFIEVEIADASFTFILAPPYSAFVEIIRSSPNKKYGSVQLNVANANTIIPV